MVRCKFACTWKSPDTAGIITQIGLSPVYSGSEENKAFFNATPGGQILFYSVNKPAADQFEIGKEYYVDFSEAPKA